MVDSRYTLVVMAAKRAKQLKEGAPKLIETSSTNPLTIALEEIAAGKVKCSVPDTDAPPLPREAEPELLTPAEMLLPEPESEAAAAEPEQILAIEGGEEPAGVLQPEPADQEQEAPVELTDLEAIAAQLDAAEAAAEAEKPEAPEMPQAEAAPVVETPEPSSVEEAEPVAAAEAALETCPTPTEPPVEEARPKRSRKKAASESEAQSPVPEAEEAPAEADSAPEEAKPKRSRKAQAV